MTTKKFFVLVMFFPSSIFSFSQSKFFGYISSGAGKGYINAIEYDPAFYGKTITVDEFWAPQVTFGVRYDINDKVGIKPYFSYQRLNYSVEMEYPEVDIYAKMHDQPFQLKLGILPYYSVKVSNAINLNFGIGVEMAKPRNDNGKRKLYTPDTFGIIQYIPIFKSHSNGSYFLDFVADLVLHYQLKNSSTLFLGLSASTGFSEWIGGSFNYHHPLFQLSMEDVQAYSYSGKYHTLYLGYKFFINQAKKPLPPITIDKRNAIYIEGAGLSDFVSINYERTLKKSINYLFAVKTGAGIKFIPSLKIVEDYSLSSSIVYLFGTRSIFLEAGLGGQFNHHPLGGFNSTDVFGNLGIRYQFESIPLNFRLINYFVIKLPNEEFKEDMPPFTDNRIGFSVGYAF